MTDDPLYRRIGVWLMLAGLIVFCAWYAGCSL